METINDAFQRIVYGERLWTAIGDFLNYWHVYAADRREQLVQQPLVLPREMTPEVRRWAAFCAATVEYLCERFEVPCPAWVHHPVYTLPEPWYTGLGANKEHVQARLRQEAPEPFRKRNVFCRERSFSTKYEIAAKVQIMAVPQPELV
ncbi:hypothetical protein [Thermosporothrix hazakensis]|nr:hypothetical protein [Thermosporothrix hazakensis]